MNLHPLTTSGLTLLLISHSNNRHYPLLSLLKEEGDLVQELSDVGTKAAEFHARLEAIEKAIEIGSSTYNAKEAETNELKTF